MRRVGYAVYLPTPAGNSGAPNAAVLLGSMSERQMALASRKPQAPTYLASRPSADWQDVVVQCPDGLVGRVQAWKNGWVRGVTVLPILHTHSHCPCMCVLCVCVRRAWGLSCVCVCVCPARGS